MRIDWLDLMVGLLVVSQSHFVYARAPDGARGRARPFERAPNSELRPVFGGREVGAISEIKGVRAKGRSFIIQKTDRSPSHPKWNRLLRSGGSTAWGPNRGPKQSTLLPTACARALNLGRDSPPWGW